MATIPPFELYSDAEPLCIIIATNETNQQTTVPRYKDVVCYFAEFLVNFVSSNLNVLKSTACFLSLLATFPPLGGIGQTFDGTFV